MFAHGEDYDGWMTWLFGEGMFGLARSSIEGTYEGFSKDIKARVGRLKGNEKDGRTAGRDV